MVKVNEPGFTDESCIPQETTIEDVKLAHAYVPIQKFCRTFAPMTALMKGTIFPALSGLYDIYWKKMREMKDE
ncbi:MAG TPA: spore coat associated protein CotJA [Clostridiales bacterium]|jgi:hypothetical protein|nr:spore coat associated protein CotJA [Clostridiales bacterium]